MKIPHFIRRTQRANKAGFIIDARKENISPYCVGIRFNGYR